MRHNHKLPSLAEAPKNRLQWAIKATLPALAILLLGFGGTAWADTFSFTFTFEPPPSTLGATVTLVEAPTSTMLTVPETLLGHGLFEGLGPGTLMETGNVTFLEVGPGVFFPEFINNNVTVTFDAVPGVELTGHNHITFAPDASVPGEIDLTTLATITGGTGIFTGATGSTLATGVAIPTGPLVAGATVTATFAGSGTVTTPAPEPTTLLLSGMSLLGLAGMMRLRKRS